MADSDYGSRYVDGLQYGSRVATNVALRSIATAALNIIGKDGADGVVDLGALGRWHAADDGHGGFTAVACHCQD